VAPAKKMTCLRVPTPDALTRSGDSGGDIQRGISRTFRARDFLDLLVFCRPSPPDYMRVILGTGRGALAIFLASHEFSFKVPSDCYTMAPHRVLGLTAERASHVRKCPRCKLKLKLKLFTIIPVRTGCCLWAPPFAMPYMT
jgi:hypothetical protein